MRVRPQRALNPVSQLCACKSAASPPAGMAGDFDADAYVTLRSGARMPRVGFGTAGLGDRTAVSVGAALAAGYRLLDSAQAREWYREDLVGAALEATALPRESVFVTTKIHPRHLGYAQTAERVAVSLRELQVDCVDLLLLHYPACWGDLCGGETPAGTWRDSWRALEAAKAAGQARALGVSNFDAAQLRELLQWAKEPPDVVQAHSDPFSQARPPAPSLLAPVHALTRPVMPQNRELQRVCAEHGVVFQAYSSLGLQWWGAGYRRNPVLHAPVVEAASVAHQVTPAQVVLRWALHRGQASSPSAQSTALTLAAC